MSVFVDPLMTWGGANAPQCFRFKPSCHMYGANLEELHAMAIRIGLRREWFQDKPELPHYDLTATKRALAVRYGAVQTSFVHVATFMAVYQMVHDNLDEIKKRIDAL